MSKIKRGKEPKKKKKDKKKVKTPVKVTPIQTKVIENTKACKVEVINNLLPWEREVLSEHSHFKFTTDKGNKYTVKYDERNSAISISCDNGHCVIQPVSVNQFLIK